MMKDKGVTLWAIRVTLGTLKGSMWVAPECTFFKFVSTLSDNVQISTPGENFTKL